MLNKFKNKLIVMEGSDGCGKTTVAQLLVNKLNENNIPAVFTYQPGDSNYGVLAPIFRSLCKDKRWDIHPLSNMYAFYLDRIEQMDKVIIPALNEGKTVVSDRWWYSTYAYQYFGKEIMKMYNMPLSVAEWFSISSELGHHPNVVYFFPEKIKKPVEMRKSDSGNNDLFETAGQSFEERVAIAYDRLAKDLGFKIVHPASTPQETLDRLIDIEF